MRTSVFLFAFLLVLFGCGSSTPDEPTTPAPQEPAAPEEPLEEAPTGRLPSDVRPTHYALSLNVVPSEDRFSGRASIDVTFDHPRAQLWMHGRDMNVQVIRAYRGDESSVPCTWRVADAEGVAEVRCEGGFSAGNYTIDVFWDAPFDRQLKGLYRVDTGGESYAFTQFEAISARYAFPCFDEPAFKTPFDIELVVKNEHTAIANTREIESTVDDAGMKHVKFATTEPLPTYLVAFVVGPVDVVTANDIPANDVRDRPLPFRGVAVKGKGPELAYALEHTPKIVAELERYFGIAYPYDKLDVIAVPDFASGAMENAGAITFREYLLLVNGQSAPERQKRGFAYVMAHELAHQWFGNLVTMPWWDDIWLNEAFATWMGNRATGAVFPEYHTDVSSLESSIDAMGSDSLVNARQIRQPIVSNHDIRNAFDSITYQKGGGILRMFEGFVGDEVFRQGIHRYLERHRFGSATGDDFLNDVFEGERAPLASAFRTFLEQPGVPLIETSVTCDGRVLTGLTVRQRRYLPAGSEGDAARTWRTPLCLTRNTARPDAFSHACVLVTEAEQSFTARDLRSEPEPEGTAAHTQPQMECPTWWMPNANGAGYFRWSMPSEDLARLRRFGWAFLSELEKISVADSLRAGFASGAIPAADALSAMETLARDPSSHVAVALLGLIEFARDRVAADAQEREKVEAWARRIYAPVVQRLGWAPRRGATEDGETALFRAKLLNFLALVANDPAIRREAARRGKAYVRYPAPPNSSGIEREANRPAANLPPVETSAVSPDLAGLCLAVAIQDGDAQFFDHVRTLLSRTDDAVLRGQLIGALASTRNPELATRARDLALDPMLRINEVLTPIGIQMGMPETREDTWTWFQERFDALAARVATTRGGETPWMLANFCDTAHADQGRAFFEPRLESLPGAPRNLAGALEAISLCAARVEAQRTSTRAFFSLP